MSHAAGADASKTSRGCGASHRTEGLKFARLPLDPHSPGFRDEAERHAKILKDAPEERDALDFIEAAADWIDDEERSKPT